MQFLRRMLIDGNSSTRQSEPMIHSQSAKMSQHRPWMRTWHEIRFFFKGYFGRNDDFFSPNTLRLLKIISCGSTSLLLITTWGVQTYLSLSRESKTSRAGCAHLFRVPGRITQGIGNIAVLTLYIQPWAHFLLQQSNTRTQRKIHCCGNEGAKSTLRKWILVKSIISMELE